MDGTYLVGHPREYLDHTNPNPVKPTRKLLLRRKLARYENIAGAILDQIIAALFREQVTRTIGGQKTTEIKNAHPLKDWWDNVDGAYCDIDSYMSDAFALAAIFGHVFHYMDRPDEEEVITAADEPQPLLTVYTPLDVPDWRESRRGKLLAVRLLESPERTNINEALNTQRPNERIVTDEYWELQESVNGQTTKRRGDHGFGTLPIVVQYAKRRALLQPLIGDMLLGKPELYIDHYNIISETRELERGQTFGILNVPLGTGADRVPITEAQTMLGDEKGAENVMFTPGNAQFIQPDSANVTVYHEERTRLERAMFRLCGLPWESDSKDAEAEGSLQRKREDLNQRLSKFATECQKTEYSLVELWFRATYGPEQWEAKYDDAKIQIQYPSSFDITPFADLLEQAQAGQALEMGRSQTFSFELSKRLLPKFLPELPAETVETIEEEFKAEPVKSPAQQKLEEMALRFGDKPQPGPGGAGV